MDGVLHHEFMGDTKTCRHSFQVADGTHDLQRLLIFREDLLNNCFSDLRFYLFVFDLRLLPCSENLILSMELVDGVKYDAISVTFRNGLK